MSKKISAVLFVDDEESILTTLRRSFKDLDVVIFTAMSGEEGLAIFKKESIDLIVADVMMPEMNGIEFLRQVMELDPNTKRLILTGYAEMESVIEALSEGYAQQVIRKPLEEEQLKQITDWISPK